MGIFIPDIYNILMKKHLFCILATATLTQSFSALAASESSTSNINFFATVNNTMLTKGLLDLNVKAAVA